MPNLCQSLGKVVGVAGFEPATPSSRTTHPHPKSLIYSDRTFRYAVNGTGTNRGNLAEAVPFPCHPTGADMTDEIDALATLAKALRETIHQHPSLAEPINQVARNITKLMKTPGDEKLRRQTAMMIESLLHAIEKSSH